MYNTLANFDEVGGEDDKKVGVIVFKEKPGYSVCKARKY